MRANRGRVTDGEARGQSAVVGFVLVVGLSMLGIASVLFLGAGALTEVEERASLGQAENAFSQFDARASGVALGDDDVARVDTGLGGADGDVAVAEDAGWLRVTVTDEDGERQVVNETLGAVTYSEGDTVVAYQGGGVWRAQDGGTTLVSSPEFHYRDDTLTLPILTVEGDDDGDGTLTVRREATERVSLAGANPLDGATVEVTVRSDYYRGWDRYFDERTEGQTSVDDDARTATVTLVAPETRPPVGDAVRSTARNGDFVIAGNGAKTDAYDSRVGAYDDSKRNGGDVRVAGDADVRGNAHVRGDVRSGGDLEIRSNAAGVDGDVYWTDDSDLKHDGGYDGGERIDGVETVESIDGQVESAVDRAYHAGYNDNGDTDAIDGERLVDGSATLDAGRYALTDLTLSSGDRLTLDTTDGDVTLAVRDSVHLSGDAEIAVEGPGSARVYTGSAHATDGTPTDGWNWTDPNAPAHVLVEREGGAGPQVTVEGDRASGFWLYGTSRTNVRFDGSQGGVPRFTGVVYAPAGPVGESSVALRHAEVYGGIVAGQTTIEQGGAVHYDRALTETDSLPTDDEEDAIRYLHVTRNRMTVS
ncbi:DUF7289 family protein [Halomarina ordinaria]|uniref:DUF7305 domain-containing protein n=1 Tax=Halomarina ordinaria TaxID=3033939 RepID=A0ABD5U7J8_9EURY|nr:hypothetical protein [Halomarina sp. PSRA2]